MISPRHIDSSLAAVEFARCAAGDKLFMYERFTVIFLDTLDNWTGFMKDSPAITGQAILVPNMVKHAHKIYSGRSCWILRNTVCGEFTISKRDLDSLLNVYEAIHNHGIQINGFCIYNDIEHQNHHLIFHHRLTQAS